MCLSLLWFRKWDNKSVAKTTSLQQDSWKNVDPRARTALQGPQKIDIITKSLLTLLMIGVRV